MLLFLRRYMFFILVFIGEFVNFCCMCIKVVWIFCVGG